MSGKSVNLDEDTLSWVNTEAARRRRTFSRAVNDILREHKRMYPEARRQEEVAKLRAACTALFADLKVPQEAILSWARAAAGGWEE